ncbi:MAG: MBL fold metallo-hydrolase [Alphaproteobacteria bacterium]|nr:MBL fold metallo-hydrolase [Alphaproteobacteria bacterium]
MHKILKPALIGAAVLLVAAVPASAQDIKALKDGIHVITGKGGNIGVSVGADGVFMIDDQFAPATDAILAQIESVTDQPVRFLVNTHHHGDHNGGNENLGKRNVLIFAHDNVRARLLAADKPKAALPVVTFNDTTTFHMNGQTLHVRHLPSAHTGGDSFVHFVEADVIHTGDLFFNGFYPFIDEEHGGSITGMIAAVGEILKLAGPNTKIIPGHGPLADKAALSDYREMLMKVRADVKPLVDAGKSKSDVISAKPTQALDAERGDGFLKPDAFVGLVYASLKK